MERVADGIFAIMHDDATEVWPNGNTGVVVGDSGVLVFDADYLPSRARADIALIRRVTALPVRYVVISHLHRDHNGGTSAYHEAFPGALIVSGPQTRDFIAINRAATAHRDAVAGSPLRATLAALEARSTSGRDTTGRVFSATEKAALDRNIRERRVELEDLSHLDVVVPNLTVSNTIDVFLGTRRVQVRDRGRANSPDDVTAFVPDANVLFTGDIVVESPLPYTGATWPVEWASVLRDLEAMAPAAIVPGHGPVMRDASYLAAMRELIEDVNGQVASLLRQGLTLDQILARVDVAKRRAAVAEWLHASDENWAVTLHALIERSWHELRGLD
jgi:cyclase